VVSKRFVGKDIKGKQILVKIINHWMQKRCIARQFSLWFLVSLLSMVDLWRMLAAAGDSRFSLSTDCYAEEQF